VQPRAAPARCNGSERDSAVNGKRDYLIVFGAAVTGRGRPSPVLAQRIAGACAWAERDGTAMVIATGAVGGTGIVEANVIAEQLVACGIAKERILVEPCGRDTLESVRFCHRILMARGDVGRVVCCTSTFHQRRCALLFRLLGYRTARPPMPARWGRVGTMLYLRWVAKEVLATPYDALLLVGRRALGRT
jgi:uncharacterized SAM-binding protein YcdF (DUF218 family)